MPAWEEICELSILGPKNELMAYFQERGIVDYIESSCDFLDIDEGEADAWLEQFEAGHLKLPILIYCDDENQADCLRAELLAAFGDRVEIQKRWIANQIWQNAWNQSFRDLITEKFWIGPLDNITAEPKGKHEIHLEPSRIFGAGDHATTEAMVRLLERHAPLNEEPNFLDVGTGTGVLTLVAAKLGYRELVGSDIETEALDLAEHHAQRHGVKVHWILGSLPEEKVNYGTIACNILQPTLNHLLPELVTRLHPRGRLFISGFHRANSEKITAILSELGAKVSDEEEVRGWLALMAEKIS